ncbi:MAG: type II secretion system F family protein [Immundisolibacteraceae bacterium]|nr:type II secretion system F family protein [Immundisolibacteraceae bacterium]
MIEYQYRARTHQGEMVAGIRAANDPSAVASELFSDGLIPIDISPRKQHSPQQSSIPTFNFEFTQKVDSNDLIQFSRQMRTLTKSGVPLLEGLKGLTKHARNKTFRKILNDIVISLEAGRDLATSLNQHPKVFSLFYIGLIKVGESSGQLEEIFGQLCYYLEREQRTRKQVKSALRYPSFVILALGVAMTIINLFVIPAFARVFESFDTELPIFTRILLGISNFTVAYWPWLLTGVTLLVLLINRFLQTETGKRAWDRRKMQLPLVGPVLYNVTMARFSRLFAIGYRAGVPTISALKMVGKAMDNLYAQDQVLTIRVAVEKGQSFSNAVQMTNIFDPLALQMVTVGEASGALDDLLHEIADYTDQEVEYAVDALAAAIEPILTIFMGIMVLILALGVFLPMWDLGGAAMH